MEGEQFVVGGHRRRRPWLGRCRGGDPAGGRGGKVHVGQVHQVRGAQATGGLAGFESDQLRAGRPGRQRGAHACQHRGGRPVAVQQENLDQRPGALGSPVGGHRRVPERLMGGGERALCPGDRQRRRAGQRAGLAEQDLQVVVQHVAVVVAVGQPRVAGDLAAAVEDDQMVGS